MRSSWLHQHGCSSHNGAGLYNATNVVGLISDSNITNNRAETTSGSFQCFGGVSGGGIYGGSLTISNSNISGNKAIASMPGDSYPSALGGGIYAGSLIISYSTISGNTAGASGHATYAAGGGIVASSVDISNSTVSGNVVYASGDAEGYVANGGGINSSNLTMTNCTIVDNEQYGEGGGGGIYTSSATITHSTIAGNLVGILSTGMLTLRNSIIADNIGADLLGAITSSGYNLIGNSTGGSGYVPSDLLNVHPMLGALANNGGPTQTMALLPGSPAIDSGTNQMAPEFDQRGPGFPRTVNGTIDIGAFEVQATGAPSQPDFLAFLITANSDTDE